jgi:hypothetical protein
VVWVSPNRWNNKGFRYGNVEFPMAWNQLWSGVKAYWVEVVEKYNPHACRILLSDQPHDDLERYDPSSGEGPWWVSPSGEHYWNGDHTLELLLERDIQLSPESICQFTKHHPIYCTINSKTCKYMNRDLQTAGDEFISGLVARRLRVKVDGQKQRPADKMFIQSANRLILNGTSRFKADVSANRLTSDMPSSCSVARALITAWFYRDAEDAKSLVIQFASAEDLRKALSAVIAWTLRLEDMTWLDEQASSG